MKSVILGMIGVCITLYTLLIGLNVLTTQSHKNQLEKQLSRIVQNVLEGEFRNGEEAAVKQMLLEEITDSVSLNNMVSVEINEIDLQKGILSVKITDRIKTVTGAQKEIVVEKTAIMEQVATNRPKVTITFKVGEELYKEYKIVQGYSCPMPKSPQNILFKETFVGWKEFGTEEIISSGQLEEIWENRVYVAVFQ